LASTTPARPAISAIDAAQAALAHTRTALFPIRFQKWIVLGFLAFLDQCGRTFNGGGSSWRDGRKHASWGGADGVGEKVARAVDTAAAWLSAHAAWVAIAATLGLLAICVVVGVVLWVNARGTFIYLDAVSGGRTDVGRSWKQHARAADSYFGLRFALALVVLAVVLFVGGLVGVALLAFASGRLEGATGPLLLIALVPVVALLLIALPLLALAGMALRDFVAPLQVATGLGCGPAARVLEGLLIANPGAFIVYLLLKLLVVMLTGMVVVVGGCLTCCLGFLPVVLQTLFQPLFFFERSFSLFLLKQMGYDLPARLGS
jgi:hypothetical protein